MAGDWIKLENVTPDKPEIYRIAEILEIDSDAVLGKLVRLWIWADEQTYEGDAAGVTFALLDRITSVSGFGRALMDAGWLHDRSGNLVFPNFDRHNGQTAKDRALTAKRNRKLRAKKRDARVTVGASPREEKRREENSSATQKNPLPPFPPDIDTPEIRAAFDAWLESRPRKARRTAAAMKLAIGKLAVWGPERALDALTNATIGGWQGLHEPDRPRGVPAGRPVRKPFDAADLDGDDDQ